MKTVVLIQREGKVKDVSRRAPATVLAQLPLLFA
jgi:hypothetical protein